MAAFFLAIIPAVFAALPLFGGRFIPTHDGEYHIIRFWQFYKGLSAGNWFPRWAPDLNNGYGIPLFTFNYPFPNYVGSLFHILGFSFVDSVKWTLASGYLVAVTLCFIWLKKMFGTRPAVVGTIVGAFIPYWFVDLYVRGSVGEIWAIAWVFGSFAAIAYGNRLLISLCIGLLIISHNILAVIFVPIILLYTLTTQRTYVIHIVLGIGIASYFWMPALYEQRFITGISPVSIFDHFPALYQLLIPSWGTGFRGATGGGNEMSYQIGIAPLLVFLLVPKRKYLFFVLCFVFAVTLMLPWSQWLWRIIPFVHFVQYPWRLLSIVVIVVPLFAAAIAKQFRFGWVFAILAVVFAYTYTRPVTYEPRSDAEYLSREAFVRGTSSLGNAFQTIWLNNVEVTNNDTLFIAPIAYYPGWQAFVDGKPVITAPSPNGHVSFQMPQKNQDVKILFTTTWWQRSSQIISILSLFIAFVSFILKKKAIQP